MFYNRLKQPEWPCTITTLMVDVFSVDLVFAWDIIKWWATKKGLPQNDEIWYDVGYPTALNIKWNTNSMAVDEYRTATWAWVKEFEREVGRTILSDINLLQAGDETILGFIKCIGYEFGMTTYSPFTFEPLKSFIKMPYKNVLYERQNNAGWQYWVRTRKQNS